MENSTSNFSFFGSMLKELEEIAEDQQGMLVGGFVSMSGNTLSDIQEPDTNSSCTNNCKGANCYAHCW